MSSGLAPEEEKSQDAEQADIDQAIARSDKLIGEVLANRYQIELRLGEGAMGSVYKARHVKVGRPFAVKVLHKKLLEDRKVAQRFEREAELAGRLRHPNVIGVVDVGETHDGMRYMVMDFAQGTDLATLLGEAPMPAARIIHLTRQMLEGLFHAHEAGLIHRDFKPENVIVERDDHGTELPRIVDFGIAILREGGESANAQGRLTTNGLVLGTPHYMAPEQAVADPIDHRIDLFALGIVVYEMLCGKLPFDGTGAEVARANLLLDPPPISQRVPYLEVDPLLEAFARLLMAKKREHRPPTAKAAREILDLIEKDRPAAAQRLGVSLEVVRPPTRTEPGGIAQISSAPPAEPAVIVADEPAPVAIAPPPVAAPPPIVRVSRERDIPTDAAPPLRYRRSKKGIVLGVLLAGGAAAGAFAFVNRGGDDGAKPAADNVVAMEVKPGSNDVGSQQPDPTTNPTTNPTADPGSAAPPEDGSATEPANGSTEEPKDPRNTSKRPGRDKTRPKDRGTKVAEGSGTPAKVEPPPSGSGTPAIVKAPTITAGDLKAQYARVGAELKALQQSKGDGAVADLWPRYRLIQIQQASATQDSRDSAAATLSQISKLAAGRR